MRLPGRTTAVSLLVAAMLAAIGGSTALASSGDDDPDVVIIVGGVEYTAEEGEAVTDLGRKPNGECEDLPTIDIRMTGEASLAELHYDLEDCNLKVSDINRGDAHEPSPGGTEEEAGTASFGGLPNLAGPTMSSAPKYYHWYLTTSATRRGFLYFEALTETKTHIQAWLPSMGYKGAIKNANSARHWCKAWGPPLNRWRVEACYLMSRNTRSKTAVWEKAMGKFSWILGTRTTAWSKSEIKGNTLGAQRFKSTCRHTGRPTVPIKNYLRCERKYGRLSS